MGRMGVPVDSALVDSLPDGVVIADENGIVTHVNPAAAKLLCTPDGKGKNLGDVVALQDHAGNDWLKCNDPYGGLGTRSGLTEQSWFLADGTELLPTAKILRDGHLGAVRGVAVCLRSARARARLDRERSDLVATVAHELRSPLTGVRGFVASLISRWDRLSDENRMLMLGTVNSDADRLTRLIDEMLDVARIDTGRLSLTRRPLEFAPAVNRVLESVRAGTGRGREIVFEVDGELPTVDAAEDKFVQVVTNLVENAVRHGEGAVRLSAAPIPGGDPFPGVVMHVDDEGDGISPAIRSRVFTKYWRHGPRGGSGLGLYIVHGLVRAHGGTVEIDDAPGGGARITVMWPGHRG